MESQSFNSADAETAFQTSQARFAADKALQSFCAKAYVKFQSVLLPTSSHELWRYTKPEMFDFSLLANSGKTSLQVSSGLNGKPILEKVQVKDSAETASVPAELLNEIIEKRSEDLANDGVPWLQLASLGGCTYVHVQKGAVIEEPIYLSYLVDKAPSHVPFLVIVVEEGASVTFVEDLKEDYNGFFFPRLEVFARDNSFFRFISNNHIGDEAHYLGRHRFHIGRDVNAELMHFFSGSKVSRLDLECRFHEPGSSVTLSSVYVADRNRHIDLHTVQDHLAPHCRSDLLSKGILKDESRTVYYGYIRVAEGAQRTDAYQKNRNLVLSDKARADSIPNLMIKANDVKCSHGSTVGQVSQDELFYLMTRGLTRVAAEKLLVEGFLDEVVTKIKDDNVLESVRNLVMNRISRGT